MLLISQNFLKYLKKVNDFGLNSDKAVQPLKWDPSQEKFIPYNETSKIYLAIHAFTGFLISLIHFYHAIGLGSKTKPEVSKSMEVSFKCQNFLFSTTFLVGTSFYLLMLTKGKEVADLINGLIRMESKFRKYCDFNLENDTDKTFLKKIKLTYHVCNYQVEINSMMSISIGLGASLLPSSCMNFHFFLERYSEKRTCLTFLERTGLFIVNSMSWHVSTHVGFFFLVLMAVSVNSLIAGLYAFQKSMSKAMTQNQEKRIERGINFYRQLQILTKLFGEIHRFILVQFLFTAVTSQVICIYFLVKFSNEVELMEMERVTMSGFYGTAGLDTMLIILVVYGFMADLHHRSELVKENLLEVNAFKRKGKASTRIVQKLTKSCPTLKISIGASNYLEKTSPLKFEDQIFVAVANLLLMQ